MTRKEKIQIKYYRDKEKLTFTKIGKLMGYSYKHMSRVYKTPLPSLKKIIYFNGNKKILLLEY